uniref:Replication-associated protein n=1 Tax=Prunella montanella CRESS-DNA-virus sp. TaxID=2815056 RepID=A0A8A4XCY2_9VIRU|nr:MAG: replication-associated protein [Prunella montanella CRESS-DNA-virus sp.]
MARARNYVFTLNNPDGLLDPTILKDCVYLLYQEEVGESGTHHFQGVVCFSKQKRITEIKKMLNENAIHLEVMRGTIQQASEYASKLDTRIGGPYEWGTKPGGQGTRTDLIAIRNELKSGKRFRDLVEDDKVLPSVARFMKFVERLEREYTVHPDRTDIVVTLHTGPAGYGKTHCACDGNFSSPDIYWYDGGFWDGYVAQKHVILDEFGGSTMQPKVFQRVCDKYPYTVNIKGSSAPLSATRFDITTNYDPAHWWREDTQWNRDAVYRRIHIVHYHYAPRAMRIFRSDDDGCAMHKYLAYVNNPHVHTTST